MGVHGVECYGDHYSEGGVAQVVGSVKSIVGDVVDEFVWVVLVAHYIKVMGEMGFKKMIDW